MSERPSSDTGFTRCPDCGKKGVQFHFAKVIPGEDGYGCRYCDFWFFTVGRDPIDVTNEARWNMANEAHIDRSGATR